MLLLNGCAGSAMQWQIDHTGFNNVRRLSPWWAAFIGLGMLAWAAAMLVIAASNTGACEYPLRDWLLVAGCVLIPTSALAVYVGCVGLCHRRASDVPTIKCLSDGYCGVIPLIIGYAAILFGV